MQPKNSIRRKPAFPDGMLIVLGVIILCVIVTWFIPSGQYDRILDASGRQIVDPNSFHYIESEKISLLRIPHFIVEGTIAQAEMIFFLLTIGGCYEIVMHTGVLQAIIARMAKWKVRDMAFILVFTLVFAVIAAPAGGVVSFIGFAPIFVMIARAMGYDALVGVSLVLLGGAVGAAAGPITPFTTGVAQGIAELPLYSGLSYRIICMLVLWIVTALFIARYAKKVRLDPSKSYVLPHRTKFASDDDYQAAGGAKGWNYHQGVYVYRNRRLIICGTWFDYIKKEPAYNLARIKVDISSVSDEEWKIDIKKSTASLPGYVRDTVERAIDICTEASARVYNSRGTYSKSNISAPNLSYVWEQRKKNGRYSFHINRKHALLTEVKKHLDTDGAAALSAYLTLVENFAPFMLSGVTDSLQKSTETAVNKASLEYQVEISELKEYIALFLSQGFTKEETRSTLLDMVNYRHLRNEIIELLEEAE